MNMIKNFPAVGGLSFFLLTEVLPAVAADVHKIGVVDFQKILEVSEAGKTAQGEVSKQGKQMETDLKDKGAEIEDFEKKIDRESLLKSKESREEKQRIWRGTSHGWRSFRTAPGLSGQVLSA